MELKDESLVNDGDNHSKQEKNMRPEAYDVDDDNLNQDELERSLFTNSNDKNRPVMEGKDTGGENFDKNNLSPAGDDPNNPSQNIEPSKEHPEDSDDEKDHIET
jgi:hypothetical protein